MQPPPVHYVTTADGVRIAYTVSGTGPPLLFHQESIASHVQLEWTQAFLRFIPRLAERTTLIRFDTRGVGLSDRLGGSHAPPEDVVLDIEAVVEKLGLKRFALAAVQTACLAAITYAEKHRGQVSRLVLVDGMVRMMDLVGTPQGQALSAVLAADYMLGTEAIGAAAFGVGRDESRDYGAYIRQCVGPEYFVAGPDADALTLDVSGALPTLAQPTLVLKHAGLLFIAMDAAKELATRIPNAELAVMDGTWADDIESLADRITAFVCEDAGGRLQEASIDAKSGVRTILFTDIEAHTPMMQRLGDDAGRALLREHERITRDVIARHGGSEIKTIGDAFMVSFGSVASAAQCAVELQQAFASAATDERLRIRVGLNAGEPVVEDGDLFGSSVILASRIVALAKGGEILVSDTVRGLLAGKGFLFSDRGETALRGFEDPVRLYELRWTEERPA